MGTDSAATMRLYDVHYGVQWSDGKVTAYRTYDDALTATVTAKDGRVVERDVLVGPWKVPNG